MGPVSDFGAPSVTHHETCSHIPAGSSLPSVSSDTKPRVLGLPTAFPGWPAAVCPGRIPLRAPPMLLASPHP